MKKTIAAITIFILVAIVLLMLLTNVRKQEASTPVIWQPTQQDTAASDSILPQAGLPTLKIGEKEDPDVYLQSLDIQVEVIGNIATTRYTMVFKNKKYRILEGELTFPLPDGRTVTHYALDIDGRMREAVPVEKAKATQVFEEIEQRRVDPGILERVEGNNFRTRIYPFPAEGTRTISIGYEEELPLEKGLLYYRLPMAYQNKLEKFSVKATIRNSSQKPLVPDSENEIRFDKVEESYVASFVRENYSPSRALIFALPTTAEIPQVMVQPVQENYYFLTSVAPIIGTREKQWDKDLAIILDVSLSGSQRNLQREIDMLDIIFSKNKDTKVHLYFLNNKLKKIGEYKEWDKLKNTLEAAIFDGGTDFSQINLKDIKGNEILFFSDGISTLSDANFIRDNRPVHCFVSSSKADYSALKLIASKTNGKFVNVNALSSEQLRNELLNETLQYLGTEHGNDVREVYPSIATPVQGNFSVAGISSNDNAELTLLFGFGNKVEKRIKVQLDAKNAASQGNIYRLWAQKKISELDLDYEKNRSDLIELGQEFGIVTRNTSLMVLETIEDYIRYSIEPPASEPALRIRYKHEQKTQNTMEHNMWNDAVRATDRLKEWWNTDFKPRPPEPEPTKDPELDKIVERSSSNIYRQRKLQGSGGRPRRLGAVGRPRGRGRPDYEPYYEEETYDVSSFAGQTIMIKPIRKDKDYLNKLTGELAEDYQMYLKLRNDYANSPNFYFDIANWFYTHNDRETALRILTSIAELELENASLYRLLGYRFKEYEEYSLEKFVCQKVVQWRPMEPQSYRDYALALADNGETQAALDSLYSILKRPFSLDIIERSGIAEVIVTEMNHLIARNRLSLNTSKIDKQFIINIPVDIRVVMNWNTNNTSIGLTVWYGP